MSRESPNPLSPQTSGDPIYTVIPLPPREPQVKRNRVALATKPARYLQRPNRTQLPYRARKHRNEFLQAFGIAVVINLLLAFGLLYIVIDSEIQREESFFVAQAVEDSKSEDRSSESQKDSATRTVIPPSIDRQRVKMKPPLSSATFTPSFLTSQQEMSSLEIADPTLNLRQSLSIDAFVDVAVQKRENNKKFVESKATRYPAWAQAGLEGTGVDIGMIEWIFTGEQMGDGSKAVIYLDISGSMMSISHAVETYMEKHFSGAVVRHISGCSLRQVSHPFPSALLSDPERDERTDFYLVCDLQDGES
ncbi:MAG: hypothetical protein AAGF67_14545, partial [Verrucomicrobiota bacterium]